MSRHKPGLLVRARRLLRAFCLWGAAIALLPGSSLAQETSLQGAAPSRLLIRVEQRTRAETQTNRFRFGEAGPTRVLALRSRLQATVRDFAGPLRLHAELQDSHGLWNDAPFIVEARHTNALDVTQLHAQLAWDNLPGGRGAVAVQVGRFTLDVGSRRLVARNGMRNTTNAFDGILAAVRGRGSWRVKAFVTRPVTIKPRSPDTSSWDRVLSGLDGERAMAAWMTLNATVLALHEGDATPVQRRHTTLVLRFLKKRDVGTTDYEVESDVQLGSVQGQPHRAFNQHVEVGHTVVSGWHPRLSVAFDYASGDRDPDDSRSQSFDPLFGARRFDFAPTGIYGPFFRSNLISPGLRCELAPSSRLDVMVSFRSFWLAQARDAWVGSGLRDPSGSAGRFIGHHIESRARWRASSALRLEAGYAHFFKGSYLERVPTGPRSGDSDSAYIEALLSADLLRRD